MRSPFVPTSPLMPADATLLWAIAVNAVSAAAGAQLTSLMLGNPPTTAQVGSQLRRLNPTTAQFVDIAPGVVTDIAQLKPTISHEIEGGYKALLGGRFQVSVDG